MSNYNRDTHLPGWKRIINTLKCFGFGILIREPHQTVMGNGQYKVQIPKVLKPGHRLDRLIWQLKINLNRLTRTKPGVLKLDPVRFFAGDDWRTRG
ncbi:hypothetical protein GF359_07905 [candidate division WOR-3 bacterium]|uniref:Uncharacterized protein n=1 Tax=candidate division WOR-3 bacterium TaxID=2052148 RepID=A0A9D5KAE9_UNCW3|nr:hypothetical protein [candidate division WOR-3 bacterium]MBD3365124.1 hypothetical protein [candidate division WOR-3 bacterium]